MQASLRDQMADWRERRFAGLEPDLVKEERANAWELALLAFARAEGVELAKLAAKKSTQAKVVLAAAMKQATSASNGWLAQRLGMGKPASVSQFVRRWMMDERKRGRGRRLLSKVEV